MNHGGDNIQNCSILGDNNVTGGWPELADLCTSTEGCVAVNLYADADTHEYMYCLKSDGTGLEYNNYLMTGPCMGILVKVLPGEWLGGHGN